MINNEEKDNVRNFLEKKQSQMEECEHLFLKTKEEEHYLGFHSSDSEYDPCEVICLKCGLTNKYVRMNSDDRKFYLTFSHFNPYFHGFIELNDKIFKEQFPYSGRQLNDSVFNLISSEAWDVRNPSLLYSVATSVKPNADNEEIYDTMKELYEIETPIEKVELINIDDAQELIARYKKIKGKVYKK